MKTRITLITLFIVLGLSSAQAAKSPAMETCSKQWNDMKAAGQTGGKTWPSFWSQCSKDFAAKGEGGDVAIPAEKPAKAEKSSRKSTTTARNEDDNSNSAAQKKDCDARWDANKTKTGAHGWHDYFQFMSQCM
jgi:hypothetical protein